MIARSRRWAGAGLAALIVLGSAAPASAHPILLRTDPAPQTTVAVAPDAVRLYFSEPLEVALTAVEVDEADGHQVESGPVGHGDGDRQVIVGVHLRNGTHTVNWRVTSDDGHTVHGNFSFSVGAPSAVAPVAAGGPADHGASVGATWGAGVVRFAWFAALCVLVGFVVIRRWVWTPSLQATGLAATTPTGTAAGTAPAHPATAFRRCFARGMVGAWVVLAVAGVLSLVFQTASVSALSLSASTHPSALAPTLHSTFGRVWEARMALVAVGAVPVLALVRRRPTLGASPATWIALGGVVVGGLCFASALDGHARTMGRAALEVPSLALHLGAVTVWVGGLAVFMVVGGMAWRTAAPEVRARLAHQLVVRFGRVAVVAVAIVVVTGVVNAYGDFGALSDLWRVAHGRVVTAKVVLLVLALGLAARHRWVTSGHLAVAPGEGATQAVRSLRRDGLVEVAALVAAVALAAALVALAPGRSLAVAAGGPMNQSRHAGSYTVRLVVNPTRVGANEVHVTFVNSQGLGASEVTTAEVSVGPTKLEGSPIPMRLVSPGQFVGDMTLGVAGGYRLSVTTVAHSPDSATFAFDVQDPGQN